MGTLRTLLHISLKRAKIPAFEFTTDWQWLRKSIEGIKLQSITFLSLWFWPVSKSKLVVIAMLFYQLSHTLLQWWITSQLLLSVNAMLDCPCSTKYPVIFLFSIEIVSIFLFVKSKSGMFYPLNIWHS